MVKIIKFVGIAVISAALIIGALKGPEIKRLLAVNSLFDEGNIVHNFSHMEDAFFHSEIAPANPNPSILNENLNYQPDPKLQEIFNTRNLTAIVATKDNVVRFEQYFKGTTREDNRISWSVAKSFLSALMGIMVEKQVIKSIDDPVVKYAPSLAESAYKHVSIKQVMQMQSGVLFNEDYLDKNSDINKMGRTLALGGKMDDFASDQKNSFTEPGTKWQYVSIDTHVLGMVIAGATGRNVIDLMRENIIEPLGFEGDSYYVTDKSGVPFVLGGLNLTTRDYIRFGLMMMNDGKFNGVQIVPSTWVDESTKASANMDASMGGYGYQWWIPPSAQNGEFLARGVYGQYIYINKPANVVIAINSADRDFTKAGVYEELIAMFRQISSEL